MWLIREDQLDGVICILERLSSLAARRKQLLRVTLSRMMLESLDRLQLPANQLLLGFTPVVFF
jgi:hypothetical protein